jgi:hypothetical protein
VHDGNCFIDCACAYKLILSCMCIHCLCLHGSTFVFVWFLRLFLCVCIGRGKHARVFTVVTRSHAYHRAAFSGWGHATATPLRMCLLEYAVDCIRLRPYSAYEFVHAVRVALNSVQIDPLVMFFVWVSFCCMLKVLVSGLF